MRFVVIIVAVMLNAAPAVSAQAGAPAVGGRRDCAELLSLHPVVEAASDLDQA